MIVVKAGRLLMIVLNLIFEGKSMGICAKGELLIYHPGKMFGRSVVVFCGILLQTKLMPSTWLLSSGLQGLECIKWAEALQPEHILSRILWIMENTLNPQLIEKSVGLLLSMLESQKEVEHTLLSHLMKLDLASILVNLLAFEMSKLMNDRIPDRYPVLDVILRALEALCVIDVYSLEICSNKEFFQLVCDLIKFPDKVEVSTSCVTAGVLIANILSDVPDLASNISQIFLFCKDCLIFSHLLLMIPKHDVHYGALLQGY